MAKKILTAPPALSPMSKKLAKPKPTNSTKFSLSPMMMAILAGFAGLFYYSVQLDQPYTLTDAANPYLINAANPYYIHGTPTFDNPDGQFYYQVGAIGCDI